MFNILKVTHLLDSSNDLSRGFYNGTVVDNDDPEGLSRVKVEIPTLTKGIPVDKLPWYSIKSPIHASPNSKASIPTMGSEVVVEFSTDDIYNGQLAYVIVSKPPETA
jgi:hypothetical protein